MGVRIIKGSERTPWQDLRSGVATVDPDGNDPVLMTNGCAENILSWKQDWYNPWGSAEDCDEAWTAWFTEHGIPFGRYNKRWDPDPKGDPYVLTPEEFAWVAEDSDSFTDGSCAYWTYATTSLHKRRKWLAPFMEYQADYDPVAQDEIDGVERDARFRDLQDYAARHLRAIVTALEELPFDTMVEIGTDDLDAPLEDEDNSGYRIYLDLAAAMKHFGSFDEYKAWTRQAFTVFMIVEEPV